MSQDGADEAAGPPPVSGELVSGELPADSAPATVPRIEGVDGVPSAPSTEPRRPTLPPSPPTVPRPTTARSARASVAPPPASSPSSPATARQPSIPGSTPAAASQALSPSVPRAPRAPHIEPYDSEVTTEYDPFGDDAPTVDYDPRARGIYSAGSGASRPAAPLTLPASQPPRAAPSPSGPPQVASFGSDPAERGVASAPSAPPRPATTTSQVCAAPSPPSSQRRRSSRRAVPLPTEGVERSAFTHRPASVPPPAAPPVPAGFEASTLQRESPIFAEFDDTTVIKPMRILSIGSEPPTHARMATPAHARPAMPFDSQPIESRAHVPQLDGIGSPPVPQLGASAHQDLEHGWTPMPTVVAESQETVPVMPAVTEAMLAEAGFVATAPPAQRPSEDIAQSFEGASSQSDVPADLRRTQQIPRRDVAALEEANAGHESESEPEDFEVIEESSAQPPVRAVPPPPPPKPARPVTASGAAAAAPGAAPPATAPPAAALPAAAAPAAAPAAAVAPPPPPPAREPASSMPTLHDEGGVKKPRPWWEDLFGDDYLRTLDRLDAKHVKREVDFIEESLGLERGAVILDLACGEGQHAVDLASRGYSVVGFDLSLPMLARAADEAQEKNQKINFLHGDMREMAFEEMFDGIYCWSTSFGYFDDERNVEVLQRIHRALRVGGNFLLDVVNRDYVSPRAPSLVWFEGEGCTCMDDMHVDFFTSRLRVKRTAMFDDGHSRELDYSIRLYALHELGKMLHEAGFKVVEVTGHHAHAGVFFGAESPRMIILAERA